MLNMAYLRQHYTSQRLLNEATDLILSSWRQKTTNRMTHYAGDGLAGVLHGKPIQFQDL